MTMNALFLKKLLAAVTIATALLVPLSATAASNMFLRLDGIPGESTIDKHANEIDLLSWSWGETTGTAKNKGLLPTGCITDLNIVKNLDIATPLLIVGALTGAVIPTGTLAVAVFGEKVTDFFIMTMTNVTITSYRTGGSVGDLHLVENITLHFERMDGVYKKQKPDGSFDAGVTWSIGGSVC
jgi:type VI secretion system secreted protein Hcp